MLPWEHREWHWSRALLGCRGRTSVVESDDLFATAKEEGSGFAVDL